jgi:hypothetical protein
MSVIEISPDLIEVTTLVLQPSRSFSSSSSGLTGSVDIFSNQSQTIRSFVGERSGTRFVETDGVTADDDFLYDASQQVISGVLDVSTIMETYLRSATDSAVNAQQFSTTYPVRYSSPPSVIEGPSGGADQDPGEWINFQRKSATHVLMREQRIQNPLSFNAYTNYNSLNFVSSSNFGTSSALVFPNFPNIDGIRDYTPEGPFSLDFFIKPRAPIDETGHFRAGTVFHLSSSICVSLISGSIVGIDGKPDTFRVLLQLSQSADIAPSSIDASSIPLSFPANLIFSPPEELKRDSWHRVTIRWGGSTRSYGDCSINIDEKRFIFNIPSSSISTGLSSDALVIGNYYNSGDRISKFFNTFAAINYGTLIDPVGSTTDPVGFGFSHPLNAEIHNLTLFKRYITDSEVSNINDIIVDSPETTGPAFFLPPFFTSSIPSAVFTYYTPTSISSQRTDSPVSFSLASGYNSTFVNLQNFTIDFARVKQSRAYNMSEGTVVTTPFDSRDGTVEQLLMQQQKNRARNFFILPCDDGNFEPSFSVLEKDRSRFKEIGFGTSSMLISMDSLVPAGIYVPSVAFDDFSYDGSDPYLPLYQNVNYGSTTTRSIDNSSNRSVMFSVPSLYYMTRIVPGTLVMTDSSLSGSGGLSMTLRDDSRGNIYRSDSSTKAAAWNRVGSVFYDHGIITIISPHLSFFGKNSFEISFRGEMRKTVANFSVPARSDLFNKSNNQTYKSFPPTNLISEQAEDFVYISGINLHDENFNIVMRANLSQVVQKREGDEITFRLRYDF